MFIELHLIKRALRASLRLASPKEIQLQEQESAASGHLAHRWYLFVSQIFMENIYAVCWAVWTDMGLGT